MYGCMCTQVYVVVWPPHSQPSKYNRNVHKWSAAIKKPGTYWAPDRIERHSYFLLLLLRDVKTQSKQ